jgi:predicted GNAT family acetyltransferase
VQPARAPDGSPRFVIRSRGEIASEAGVNWRSPHFAELFVRTEPWARGRGWGKAVVASCAMTLIESGVQPLYMVDKANTASRRLAEAVGFVDTGSHEFAGSGVALG